MMIVVAPVCLKEAQDYTVKRSVLEQTLTHTIFYLTYKLFFSLIYTDTQTRACEHIYLLKRTHLRFNSTSVAECRYARSADKNNIVLSTVFIIKA